MIAMQVSFFCLLTLLFSIVYSTDSTREARKELAFQGDPEDGPLDILKLHRSLRFDPPEIDFGVWSVGVARSHKVTLVNENANRSVYLSSVSGRTPIFYSSFFESRVVPPLANTTFEVVFLPRQSAVSLDYLLVHTSFGQARLLVRGEGFDCPYRLQPIVGIKAPLNALLTPEIYMYNPHSRPLQIVEVYSSGGQFKLELPSGLPSAPQALWEIPPHTTKPVIRIKFQGNSVGNHTAYIRIKIAPHSDDDVTFAQISGDDVLVVPVEFEIFAEQGMYAANPVLDFGRLTNTKPRKPLQLNLELRNSDESRSLERVGLAEGESLITGLKLEESGGILTLDTQTFNKTTSLDELLILQAKSEDNKSIGPKFTVRVRAEIFKGTLHYNRNTSVFITGVVRCKEGETRTLNVRNDFEFPLSFLNINIKKNDSKAIQVQFATEYHDGLTLHPGESFDLLHLQLMNISMHYKTQLLIVTNITNFELPLVICSGRLHVATFTEPVLTPGENFNTELNMGTVPLGEMSQDGYIVLYNPNPIAVKLTNWNFKSPQGVYFHTTSIGCLRPVSLQMFHLNQSVSIEHTNFRFCSQLGEGDISVFEIAIQSHVTELSTATLQIWTPYETIISTIVFHTWIGKLEVDQEQLYFRNCFPGRLCTAELSIHSTFQHPIHITSINFTNEAIRFENEDSKNLIFALTPNAATRLGRIYFEPALHCQNRCYLPLDDKLNNLAFPTHLVNENNNFHFDETELRRRTELYRQMKWYFRDISFTIRSRELRQLQLQAFIDIEWPKLVKGGKQKFPNIEMGKVQEQIITIRNPTDKPLLVDYFLSDPRYAQQTKLSLPLEVVAISSSCYLTDKQLFSIPSQKGLLPDAPILIPPHGNKDVLMRFEAPAHERDTFCTLLHIRNNLTLYEAVWLSARVVESQFRFGNRKPGSSTPLLYDLQDKHLAACPAPVLAKRSFTARNTGEVPIRIDTFLIDDQECEGYGFKVYGCGKGFELKTNQSRKIEIAFRPDFTASRVMRLLTIRTNLSYQINYTLQAQLPPTSLLEPCVEAIKRPIWENQARIAGLFLLFTSFILVVAAAHVDSESISQTQSALYVAREKGPVHPTFNLRNIAVKAAALSSGSSANGRKGSNHYIHSKANNQQKKRPAATSAGGGGSNIKKYPSPCIDPFCMADHNDPWQQSVQKSTEESCSKAVSAENKLDVSQSNSVTSHDSTNDESTKSTSISTNSTVVVPQKTPSPVANRVETMHCKKQKTPPLQNSVQHAPKNKTNAKGKPKSTPPPAQNPIIELMDKVVTSDVAVKEEKRTDRSPKPVEKRVSAPKLSVPTTVNIFNATAANTSLTATAMSTLTPSTTATTKIIPFTPSPPPALSYDHLPKVSSHTKNALIAPGKVNSTAISTTPSAINRTTPPMTPPGFTSISSPDTTLAAAITSKPEIFPCVAATAAELNFIPKTIQSAHNKYGTTKTPGRERRKDKNESNIIGNIASYEHRGTNSTNSTTLSAASSSSSLASSSTGSYAAKRPERKEKKPINSKTMQVQTLEQATNGDLTKNENSQPMVTSINNISSLFEVTGTQKVSLNDILEIANKHEKMSASKIASTNTTPVSADYQSPLDKAIRYVDLKETRKLEVKPPPTPLAEPILKGVTPQSFENILASELKQKKVAELGPIGTKKSPSSTPVWESVVNSTATVKVRTPLQPKPTDSNSFFSSFMGAADGVGDCNYGYNNGANPLMEGISTTDLYELRKAQAELRRQLHANEYLLKMGQQQLKEQLRRQQKQQQQDMLQSMATSHWPAAEETTWTPIGFDGQHNLGMGEGNNKMPTTNSGLESLGGRWQTSTPVRPPPGLGVVTTSSGFPNGLPSQQQLTHSSNYNNNGNNTTQKEQEEARVFDPFSSLSSIWSDNWKQLNKQNDNGASHGEYKQ